MELLKDWSACICITLIVAIIFSMLTPKGRMSSFYKIMVSLFVFLSFIYPLKNSNFNIKFPDEISFAQSAQTGNESVIENMLIAQIKTTLSQNGVENSTVTADVSQYDEQIEVLSVSVAVGDEYEVDTVKQIIFDKLGINAEVHKIGN